MNARPEQILAGRFPAAALRRARNNVFIVVLPVYLMFIHSLFSIKARRLAAAGGL